MNYQKTNSGLLVPSKKELLTARDELAAFLARGRFQGTLIRDGEVIEEFEDHNLITNEGLNAMLGVMLYGNSQINPWYLALYTGNYTPLATDTAATLPGNATECTGYTAGVRQQWVPAAPSSQSITNSASRATYTFNATQTIYGAFMTSSQTIGGTGGTSFAAALFGTAKNVVNSDQLLLTYTFSASST